MVLSSNSEHRPQSRLYSAPDLSQINGTGINTKHDEGSILPHIPDHSVENDYFQKPLGENITKVPGGFIRDKNLPTRSLKKSILSDEETIIDDKSTTVVNPSSNNTSNSNQSKSVLGNKDTNKHDHSKEKISKMQKENTSTKKPLQEPVKNQSSLTPSPPPSSKIISHIQQSHTQTTQQPSMTAKDKVLTSNPGTNTEVKSGPKPKMITIPLLHSQSKKINEEADRSISTLVDPKHKMESFPRAGKRPMNELSKLYEQMSGTDQQKPNIATDEDSSSMESSDSSDSDSDNSDSSK